MPVAVWAGGFLLWGRQGSPSRREMLTGYYLLADIGATNARFGLLDPAGRLTTRVLPTRNYRSLGDVVCSFVESCDLSQPLQRAVIAVAAPTNGDQIRFGNNSWSFSRRSLAQQLNCPVRLINDLVALAYGVPWLGPDNYITLVSPSCWDESWARGSATIGVVAPGTGLGTATLVPVGRGWRAVASEGGHIVLSAVTDLECRILAHLRQHLGSSTISAEQVVSGRGLVNLHRALIASRGEADHHIESASDITQAAHTDTHDHPSCCRQTVDLFLDFLATVAGNFALSTGAYRGIYLGGGILPSWRSLWDTKRFADRFRRTPPVRELLERVPIRLITDELAAFRGLKALLEYDLRHPTATDEPFPVLEPRRAEGRHTTPTYIDHP